MSIAIAIVCCLFVAVAVVDAVTVVSCFIGCFIVKNSSLVVVVDVVDVAVVAVVSC